MFYVYILASKPNGTLYVGITSNLVKRVWEHKCKVVPGFAARTAGTAIRREKQIKEWKRAWKISLIEGDNPHWADVFPGLS